MDCVVNSELEDMHVFMLSTRAAALQATRHRVHTGVVWVDMVWCVAVQCGVLWIGVVWCGVVGCGVVWCGMVM